MSRVAMVRAALRAALAKHVAERLRSAGPDAIRAPNVLATLLHHPAVTGLFPACNGVPVDEPALGHRLRELMALRVAWRTSSSGEAS